MVVLFIVAVVGAVALLYYWSGLVSTARQDMKEQRQKADESEGRTQYLIDENRLLWERILLVDELSMSVERHRLAYEMYLLMPYLWQAAPSPFYASELQLKGGPLVKAINDPVINELWAEGTLESINKIPLTLIGQISEPGYDPRKGVIRQPDRWYPDRRLWAPES